MTDWNAKQYLLFKNQRTQPAADLLSRINIENPRKIIDVGCGPGNSTIILKEKFPNAFISGIDNSENMIAAAKEKYPDLDFFVCDANTGLSGLGSEYELVFSNACIQWLPDHHKLLREMMKLLKKGGILAVQIPINQREPIHKIICEVSGRDQWAAYFSNAQYFYRLAESEYFDILAEISTEFSAWTTTYYHQLKSHNDIMEWYRSTGLRPYLNALPGGQEKSEFEQNVFSEVVKQYPAQKNGSIIFPFPRFFFTAIK
ncbi:MAG: methyltransferase domain-containing protein [Eubacteriales bacterium]